MGCGEVVSHRILIPVFLVRFQAPLPNLGNVVEWSMALVLKTRGPKGSVSSNLTVSANFNGVVL